MYNFFFFLFLSLCQASELTIYSAAIPANFLESAPATPGSIYQRWSEGFHRNRTEVDIGGTSAARGGAFSFRTVFAPKRNVPNTNCQHTLSKTAAAKSRKSR